jgi:aminopeptidase N
MFSPLARKKSRAAAASVAAALLSVTFVAPIATAQTEPEDPYLAPSGNPGIDVQDYDVSLAYQRSTGGIKRATATLRITAENDLSSFSLDARAGLRIRNVKVAGKPAVFRHENRKLQISEFAPVPAGKTFRTTIRYAGKPRPIKDKSGRGVYGWLRTPGGSVTFTEPTGTSAWVPCNDVFFDKATWRMRITTPTGLLGVSTGKFLGIRKRAGSTTSEWRMNTPIQPYIQTVAVDRFKYSDQSIAGLPAFTAVAKGSGSSVAEMRRKTAAAIRWLRPKLGPYPFESTGAIVVSGLESAMETAGRPTYSPGAYFTSRATVVHEQAHMWFGNLLTARQAQDMWLHEGFATYLENVEVAERKGRRLANIVHEQYVQDGWFRGFHGQFQRVSLADPSPRYLLNSTPYFRGQAAVHALRHELGDEMFWRVLRELVDLPPGTSTSTAAVIEQAEEISGQDLSDWAQTWVYSTGYQQLPERPSHQQVLR